MIRDAFKKHEEAKKLKKLPKDEQIRIHTANRDVHRTEDQGPRTESVIPMSAPVITYTLSGTGAWHVCSMHVLHYAASATASSNESKSNTFAMRRRPKTPLATKDRNW